MKRNTVTRLIKNGRVKIYGVYYYPSDVWKKYDECLENTKQTFYIYGGDTEFIYMYDCPEVDGKFNWDFWYPYKDDPAGALHILNIEKKKN
jgi:hypothetical protein